MSSVDGTWPFVRDLIAAGASSLGWLADDDLSAAAAASPSDILEPSDPRSSVNALVFDVFATVVAWRGCIIRDGQLLGKRKGIDVDWVGMPGGQLPAGHAATLSNGNLSLLTDMAKYAGLPRDCILSAELFAQLGQ